MEYVYAALILSETGEEINEDNLTGVLEAGGADVEESRVKALVAALEDVDIEEAVEGAAAVPAGGAGGGAPAGGDAGGAEAGDDTHTFLRRDRPATAVSVSSASSPAQGVLYRPAGWASGRARSSDVEREFLQYPGVPPADSVRDQVRPAALPFEVAVVGSVAGVLDDLRRRPLAHIKDAPVGTRGAVGVASHADGIYRHT